MYNWKELTSIKDSWIEAYALVNLLYYEYGWTVTQKLCGEILHSPTKWKKALKLLRHYMLVDEKGKFYPHEIDFTVPPIEQESKVKFPTIVSTIITLFPNSKFSQVNSWANVNGLSITENATEWRLGEEDLIRELLKRIRMDSWWKNVITWDMILRKFPLLWEKFSPQIPKKIWVLNDITHVF